MKLTALALIFTTVIASQDHPLNNNHGAAAMLMGRAMDPSTMNPTQLSLLSVLKTAMPTGSNIPMPTGTSEPDWYKNLPGDVKSLLPMFYPAPSTSVESTSSSSSTVIISQAATTTSSSSSQVSEQVSSTYMPAATSTSTSMQISTSSSPSPSSSSLYSSTSTVPLLSSVSAFPSPSTNQSISVTPTLVSATPSALSSAGLRNTVHTGLLAAVAWVSVAVGFCLFA